MLANNNDLMGYHVAKQLDTKQQQLAAVVVEGRTSKRIEESGACVGRGGVGGASMASALLFISATGGLHPLLPVEEADSPTWRSTG